VAEVLPSHSVEVAACQSLKLLSSKVVNCVETVRRLAGHVEDDVQYVAVAPVARVNSLPRFLTAAGIFKLLDVYT